MLHTIQRTLQSGWRKIRTAKTAADAASAPTDLTADGTLSSDTYRCLIPETANRIVLAFVANGNNKTATGYVYLRKKDGDWELAWYGNFVAGTQITDTMYSGNTTGYFADTITSTVDIWGVQLIDNEAADRMSKIKLDPCGASEIALYWTAMSATTSWTPIMTEY